ncbi:MAG: hypothetical protein ACI8P0_002685 [Planctomycetaceae bacterium]|jgi:hypothetical protein
MFTKAESAQPYIYRIFTPAGNCCKLSMIHSSLVSFFCALSNRIITCQIINLISWAAVCGAHRRDT